MALTPEQLATLKRPFARADHEFIRSFVYLTEEAITSRIEEVDPSWEFSVLEISQSGNNAVAHARLTVCGVFRDGIGMQQINEKAGEAEKGAATDALKRCARLFGVGRYLLDAPPQNEFDKWLAERQKEAQNGKQAPTPPQRQQNAPARPAESGNGTVPNASPPSTPSSQQNGGASDDASPVNRYVCTQIRVVPFGKGGKQAQLKRADGDGVIVLLGREKLLAAGYPKHEVDEWIDTPNKWFRLSPECEVEAALTDEAWHVGTIKQVATA